MSFHHNPHRMATWKQEWSLSTVCTGERVVEVGVKAVRCAPRRGKKVLLVEQAPSTQPVHDLRSKNVEVLIFRPFNVSVSNAAAIDLKDGVCELSLSPQRFC